MSKAYLHLDPGLKRWRFYDRHGKRVFYAKAVLEAKIGRHLVEGEHTHHNQWGSS